MQKRTKVLRWVLVIAVAVILMRLFVIQIVKHDEYLAEAEAAHTTENTIFAKRGEIYMMDGDEPIPIVMNETVYMVLVDPMVADEKETEKVLSEILDDEYMVADFDDIFADKTKRYFIAAKNVPRKLAEEIKDQKVAGVWFQENTRRVYPENEMAAPLLGFVNAEGDGQYGIEGALNGELKGKNGLLKTVRDVNNVALSIGADNVRVPAENGKNLVLTIDRGIQRGVEKILAEQLNKSAAKHASVLVMDPRTGKVWAMVNLPGYNPAKYSKVGDVAVFSNGVVEDAYEPASVCKTFTFAAGIEEGVMNPETTYVNNGFTTVDGWKIDNAYDGQLDTITMQTALNYSLNTGSVQALRLLGGDSKNINQTGREKLYQYYHDRFGFGEYTGIELYESKGMIVGPNEGTGLNSRYANMTFGQNMNITMMQTAAAFSSVVNGGEFFQPTIIAGEMKNNRFIPVEQKDPVRQTVSVQTSATMREMLYNVRTSRRLYGIDKPGFYVGGKTGTAQVIKNGAYTLDETKATYIGFGGAEGELPEYVIMVKIWEGGRKIEGERHAMPIFDELSNFMQDYLKIKPGKIDG